MVLMVQGNKKETKMLAVPSAKLGDHSLLVFCVMIW